MQALDLVHPEGKSGDYAFKHALVRDALYQSLLTGPRAALHLKIAEEIERRSGNRLTEVVETLAHHYSQTDRADKAFTYLAMAARQEPRRLFLDEAGNHFAAAIALLDEHQIAPATNRLPSYLRAITPCIQIFLRNLNSTNKNCRKTVSFDRRSSTSDDHVFLVHHHYVLRSFVSGDIESARTAQIKLTAMAETRRYDARSTRLCARYLRLCYRRMPRVPVNRNVRAVSREAIALALNVDDAVPSMLRTICRWLGRIPSGTSRKSASSGEERLWM